MPSSTSVTYPGLFCATSHPRHDVAVETLKTPGTRSSHSVGCLASSYFTASAVAIRHSISLIHFRSKGDLLSETMVHSLHIPKCLSTPAHDHHPPPVDKPLRIQIEGPLVSIQKLLPDVTWNVDVCEPSFPQPSGPKLAELAYRAIYGQDTLPEHIVVRDEYLGWIHHKKYVHPRLT